MRALPLLLSTATTLPILLAAAACASGEARMPGYASASGERHTWVFYDRMPTCEYTVLGEVQETEGKRNGAGTVYVQAERMGGDAIIHPEYTQEFGAGRWTHAGTVIRFEDPDCKS